MPVSIPVSKPCPRCFSEKSILVEMKGLQRLFAGSSGLKKYRCTDCLHEFRAADRRRFRRSGPGAGVDYHRPA